MNPAPGRPQMPGHVFRQTFLPTVGDEKWIALRAHLAHLGLITPGDVLPDPEAAWAAVRKWQGTPPAQAIAAPPPPPRPPRPKPRQRSLAELLEMHEADPYAAGEAELTPEEDEKLRQHFIKERIQRNCGINGRIFNQ